MPPVCSRALPLALLVAAFSAAPPAAAQLILPKTVPVAQGDQFMIFPSKVAGMGGVSIAVADSLLDPWVNPAKAARVQSTRLHGSPLLYNISEDAGGGRTVPLGTMASRGAWSGGVIVAMQQLDKGQRTWAGTEQLTDRYDINRYATAMASRRLPGNVAVGGSVYWGGLTAVDGVDLLYGTSQDIDQFGSMVDLRLGLTKEWSPEHTLELLVLHNRFDMTHDVRYADWVFDPITRTGLRRDRLEHNQDKTLSWGLHTEYERPLAANGWRVGWQATANRHSHPKIPNYEIMSIPRDPGTTYAYNFGIGFARVAGPLTFGLDLIYEPIWSETWADAARDTATVGGGTIKKGGKTVENVFQFDNAIMRLGVGREAELGVPGEGKAVGVQFGIAMRSIDYKLEQDNHVTGVHRKQQEDWIEWTPTWGLNFRFPELTISYTGRYTTGVGRPGVVGGPWLTADAALAGSSRGGGIIVAPGAPLALMDVRVMQHQVSFSLPVR